MGHFPVLGCSRFLRPKSGFGFASAGMGHIRDRERALQLVKDAIGYTNEDWWAMKKAHMPEEP